MIFCDHRRALIGVPCIDCGKVISAQSELAFQAHEPVYQEHEKHDKWDVRLHDLAAFISCWSRDPGTRCGAVIADGKRVVSVGYNGFAQGVDDDEARYADRDKKLRMVVHCEINAILFAGRSVEGMTLYTHPFCCCAPCAAQVIQAGIKRVVYPKMPEELVPRWGKDCEISLQMFCEAGVRTRELEA